MAEKYDAQKVEQKWAQKWVKDQTFVIDDLKKAEDPFYGLFMFPYPSAEGLHIGHAFVFGVVDAMCKFKRLQGKDVFEPVGWDAFGIHSENFALKIGEHPAKMLARTTKNFTNQLQKIGIGADWTRMVDTTKPEYYKWTQWIFVQLLKKGLAVQKEAQLNWCPACKTVLADEQIEGGECERCGTVPEKKLMKQWFFKITDFADRLLDGLPEMDWSEITKSAQKNWIGRSEGAEVEFEIEGRKEKIKVFTTRPDTLFGATFVTLAPEHELVAEITTPEQKKEVEKYVKEAGAKSDLERTEEKKKTGVWTGAWAKNPVNGEKLPIWISDFVLGNVGTGAIMSVPAHDERDFEFAKKFGIPIKQVVAPFQVVETGNAVPRDDWETVPRRNVEVMVKHWEKDEWWILDWKKMGWQSFVIGGVKEGESLEEAARREVLEETGFKNLKFLGEVGGEFHNLAAAPHKGINRMGLRHGLVFELENGEREKVSEEEKVKHEGRWVPRDEVLGLGLVDCDELVWKRFLRGAMDLECFCDEGVNVNSEWLDGLKTVEAKKKMIEWLEEKKIGKGVVNFRLRDWCISRQRYWGPPVPVIHCEKCGVVPVPESDLPVELPELKEGWEPAGDGRGPLAKVPSFMKVKCPKCGTEAEREADVMDNFLDSAWYFFRYLDTKNDGEIFSKDLVGMEKSDWDEVMNLVFLRKEGKMLLGMKKRGLGEGKWNGVGGKVKKGESVKMAAVREVEEEIGVKIDPKDLKERGQLQFFNEGIGNFKCHVFEAEKWEGEPKEGEEVKPEWFDEKKLPLSEMWPDDEIWMPEFLEGKKLFWKFWLKNGKMEKHEKAKPNWLPVDLYVGGNEHAVLHLMYTRFITMALHDLGLIEVDDPFRKFRANGMILKDGKKMSKSKGNVINPEEMGEKVGFDALKSYLLFLGPLADDRSFTDEGVMGCKRWVEKMGRLEEKKGGKDSPALLRKLHQTIKGLEKDFEEQKFNTGVAKMMELTNAFGAEKEFSNDVWEKFLVLAAPFTPAFAEEMWERMGHKKSVFEGKNWPEFDPELAKEDEIELVVQVNGKVRDRIKVNSDVTEEEAVKLALESEKVKGALKGEVKKKIFVPGKLVNLVG